jgi:hypothetical protein
VFAEGDFGDRLLVVGSGEADQLAGPQHRERNPELLLEYPPRLRERSLARSRAGRVVSDRCRHRVPHLLGDRRELSRHRVDFLYGIVQTPHPRSRLSSMTTRGTVIGNIADFCSECSAATSVVSRRWLVWVRTSTLERDDPKVWTGLSATARPRASGPSAPRGIS